MKVMFFQQIRASEEDLEKERGAVLEEWRNEKNSAGRLRTSHWKLLMEGSKVTGTSLIQHLECLFNDFRMIACLQPGSSLIVNTSSLIN